jgi:transcriptional regulator GlxA family with amidase domain
LDGAAFFRLASMRHVSVLVPRGDLILSSVVGPVKILNWVNTELRSRGQEPVFQVDLVGVEPGKDLYHGLFSIHPNKHLGEVQRTDLVMIPALSGDLLRIVADNREAVDWLLQMRERGAELASLCTGAFLLAATGLMDGQRCTTHWTVAGLFQQAHPRVELRVERIITDENGFYTSGGAYSFLNLVLHLVEKFAGRDLALLAARIFEVDVDRGSQAAFLMFQGMKEHGDAPVLKAQQRMETDYGGSLNMETLAEDLALSPRNFGRRFKEATGLTPLDYLQRVRVEVAKRTLESQAQVNDAMYAVGYSDHKAFRSIFKRLTSLSPAAYRARYARLPAMERQAQG